jgi:hypothetical protein
VRVCLSVLLSLVALAQQQPPRDARPPADDAGTGVIRGRVVAGDTGAPIAYATVSILKEPPSRFHETVLTDRAGRFEIVDIPAGPLSLMVQPPTYRRRYQPGSFPPPTRDDAHPTLTIADKQTIDKLEIALPLFATINGRVVDEEGIPMSGVQVAALRLDPTRGESQTLWSGGTDDRGVFRASGLVDGDYMIRAHAEVSRMPPGDLTEGTIKPPAFAPTYYPGVLSEADAGRVRVRSGQEISGVELQLIRTALFSISGTIVDSHGTPVTGNRASIMHYYENSGNTLYMAVDSAGQFRVRDVAPGEYEIRVEPNPYPLVDDSSEAREFASVSFTVNDADVTDLLVVSRPAVELIGHVVFEQETPEGARDMQVVAEPIAPHAWGRPVRVRPDLTFTLHDLYQPVLVRGVINGKYLIVATSQAPAEAIYEKPRVFLEALAKVATEIYVGDDEQRTIDLKLAKLPEER